jgi:isoleucyl-tRNA synthetase
MLSGQIIWQAGWYRGFRLVLDVNVKHMRSPRLYPKATSPNQAVNGREELHSSITPSPSFPEIEEQVLAYWELDGTFQASIELREGSPEWVFNDGPPFANGLPHYGHLLTGYVKDLFPRYKTMRGFQVHRRFGWDTHGLPAELEAMKQLGITEKHEIESMGIAAFNQAARESVLQYTEEWQQYVTRQARWVDFDNDYKTLDINFMESVIWAFKQLHEKGLAYEGSRVLPYCWRDETPLSNHELRMDDDVYKIRQDQSITVSFPLIGDRAQQLSLDGVSVLAWTTTPWTLPTNLALAVGSNIEYSVISGGPLGSTAQGEQFLVASARLESYAKDLGYEDGEAAKNSVTRTIMGSELRGIEYLRLFDYFADNETHKTLNAWRVLTDDFVSTEDGTGIVHLAPAFGEVDKEICDAADIPTIVSIDEGARFLEIVKDFQGQQVFEANKPITSAIRDMGRLVRVASYEHSYPHCWRCRTPLIYKAVSSWFIRVTEIRDEMEALNQLIHWVPENVKDGQFGKWLAGARDWSISRNRYWGSPIPVWKSDNPNYPRVDVYGSLDELERDFGVRPTDLHRPFIDELTRPNPDDPSGESMMRRIPDVLDVWFDSGSMPFAQAHYPFEHQQWFDDHQPADFIVEYIGQTRGWFYTMHILATALFGRPAFKNVISHGIVLGSDGNKMSKSLRNYPDVNDVFNRDGSDAMRWFLMASPVVRGGNLVVTEEAIREAVRQFLLPLWSSWYFFTLYANADDVEAVRSTTSEDVLDQYILSKLGQLIEQVTTDLDGLDSTFAASRIRDFGEVLTNWYVRRSRDRFWVGVSGNPENAAAFNTLFTVLETLCRISAPLAPLVTENIWRGLTGGRSVHLTDWPDVSEFPNDHELIETMDAVRHITSVALSLRKQRGLRVRLPLQSLTVVSANNLALEPFISVLREELNVKEVAFEPLTETSAESFGISNQLSVNSRAAGPRLGKKVQDVIRATKAGDWSEIGGRVVAGGIELEPREYELNLAIDESLVGRDTAIALLDGGGFVLLDTKTTPSLEAEGLARDAVRAVQDARKAANLEVSDRIRLKLTSDAIGVQSIEAHEAMIIAETLAVDLVVILDPATDSDITVGNGSPLRVYVERNERV